MKLYTEPQAKQQFSDLLTLAETEQVMIKRQDGVLFLLTLKRQALSPFDIESINTAISTEAIIEAVRDVRER